MFQRFYTYAPLECEWPWVLRNIKQKPQEHAVHEIVDIGIYDLLHEPYTHTDNKIEAWKQLKTDGWKVVPDVPDLKGEFNKAIQYDNTEYSWKLLTELYDPSDEHQIPVIQSHYADISSLRKYCTDFIREYGTVDKIAVGSVCKMDDSNTTCTMLKLVKRYFPDTWIHAFGLRFHHLRKSLKYIDSYDSTSWTFPRTGGRPSCKNKAMRIDYFYEYIDVLNSLELQDQTRLKVI